MPIAAGTQGAEAVQDQLEGSRLQLHEHCFVCWDRHPFGLKVAYRVVDEHMVEGRFPCGKLYEGYADVIHGGVVASLLDGAMANCMLAKRLEAYTVDLRLRIRGAVRTGIEAVIHGVWMRNAGPLHLLHASISQEGRTLATARAKFFVGTPSGKPPSLPTRESTRELLRVSHERLR